MSLSQLLNRTCWIVQRSDDGDTDELGNEKPSEAELESVCEIQQNRRDEDESQGELSASDWLGVFPAGTALDTGDAVIVDGLGRFELIGAPWQVRNPRTQTESHVEATLRRVAGAEDAS